MKTNYTNISVLDKVMCICVCICMLYCDSSLLSIIKLTRQSRKLKFKHLLKKNIVSTETCGCLNVHNTISILKKSTLCEFTSLFHQDVIFDFSKICVGFNFVEYLI